MLTVRESEAEARALIASGEKTDDQWLLEIIDDVHVQEQERAALRGTCSGGCSAANLVEGAFGTICKWTGRPCEHARLSGLINLYGTINKNQLPTILEGVHSDCHLSR